MRWPCLFAILCLASVPRTDLAAQTFPVRTVAEREALLKAHQADFDYLLGDWRFTSVDAQWGAGQGLWSAVRFGEGAQVLDEYRLMGDIGETYYVTQTLRTYNTVLDRWELVSTEGSTGLQNVGTGRRVGNEMHIEQTFGAMEKPAQWRITYYDIQPDRFSWRADRSTDGGKTWVRDHLKIEATRIGPPRTLPALTSRAAR